MPALVLFGSLYLLFYSLTPERYRLSRCPKWPGALLVTLWWVADHRPAAVMLSSLVSYDLTYGCLAGVIMIALFFFLVGLGLVIGAELNAALAETPTPNEEDVEAVARRRPPPKPRTASKACSEDVAVAGEGERMSGLMEGKRGLIMGLANDKSLAWGIAKKLREHGAELAFSYQGEALEKRVRPLAEQLGSDFLIDCDVADMATLDRAFATLKERWETIDFVVHAIGFSDKNELRGKYVDTSLDNFLMTMNISAYSFVAVTKRARAMMPERRLASSR